MNLGSIPDFVAQKMTLDGDFNVIFSGLMDEYKKEFEKERKTRWDFSNKRLKDEYLKWKENKDNEAFKAMGSDVGRGRPQWAEDLVVEFEEENALC